MLMDTEKDSVKAGAAAAIILLSASSGAVHQSSYNLQGGVTWLDSELESH